MMGIEFMKDHRKYDKVLGMESLEQYLHTCDLQKQERNIKI